MEKKGQGSIYLIVYEVSFGKDAGEKFELTAPAYQFPGTDKWLVIQRHIRRRNGEIVAIPMLARYIPQGQIIPEDPESLAKHIRELRKDAGTRRIGLGYIG